MTTTAVPDGTGSDKAALRRAALARRAAISQEDRLPADRSISQSCIEALGRNPLAGDAVLAGYWPMRGEADARAVLHRRHGDGLSCALPAIVGDELVFRAWTPLDPLVPGGFGTLVPAEDSPLLTPRIVLVPMLAFDRSLNRLGYGHAFYDRALARLAKAGPVLKVGIAYAVQEVDAIPAEPHDQALDMIVTEREILYPPSA